MAGPLDKLTEWMFGPKQAQVNLLPPMTQYPSVEDAKALSPDAFYGSGHEGVRPRELSTAGTDLKKISTVLAAGEKSPQAAPASPSAVVTDQARLASLRSAIAGLGFDPRRFILDDKSGGDVTVAGFYSPAKDRGYANNAYPSALMHESVHRGLGQMRAEPNLELSPLAREILQNKAVGANTQDELLTRYLIYSLMGDPEAKIGKPGDTGQEERKAAIKHFSSDRQKQAVNELEAAAAKMIAKRRPGGPR